MIFLAHVTFIYITFKHVIHVSHLNYHCQIVIPRCTGYFSIDQFDALPWACRQYLIMCGYGDPLSDLDSLILSAITKITTWPLSQYIGKVDLQQFDLIEYYSDNERKYFL